MNRSGARMTFEKSAQFLKASVRTGSGQQRVRAIDRHAFVVRHSRTRLGKEGERLVVASPSCVKDGKIVRHVCPRRLQAPRAQITALRVGELSELLVRLAEVV